MRLIDADALKNAIRAESWKEDTTVKMAVEYINILIDEQPTINPDDLRERGRWIWDEENECWLCSNCESSALNNYRGNSADSDYCPNCGAKMDGKEDE